MWNSGDVQRKNGAVHAVDPGDQGFDLRIADAGRAQDRRFHLEHAARGKKFTHAREQIGALP